MYTPQLMREQADVMNRVKSGAPVDDVCPRCGGPESTHGKIGKSYHFHPEVACATCEAEARRIRDEAWQENRRAKATGLPGRNDPCHCGSKKKFKKCCG